MRWLCLVLAAGALGARAQPVRLDVQLAPRGGHVAWLEEGTLRTAAGPVPGGEGAGSFLFAPDGQRLFFTRPVADGGTHAFTVELDGGTVVDLTPWPGATAELVAASPAVPGKVLLSSTRAGRSGPDVYRVELPSLSVRLDTRNPGDVTRWLADPWLAVRAAVARTGAGTEVRVKDGPRSSFRRFIAASEHDTVIPLGFTEDGTGLILLTTTSGDVERVVTRSLSTGAERVVARAEGSDVLDVMGHPTKHRLRAVAFAVEGRMAWTSVDYTVTEDLVALDAALEGDLVVVSADADDERWVVAEVSDTWAPVYRLWERKERSLRPLFEPPRPATGATTPVGLSTSDGLVLRALLTRPRGTITGLALVAAEPPWQPRWGRVDALAHLAGQGFAVLQVGVRTTAGRGKRFRLGRGLSAATERTPAEDLAEALAWAQDGGMAPAGSAVLLIGSGTPHTPHWATCSLTAPEVSALAPVIPLATVGPVRLERNRPAPPPPLDWLTSAAARCPPR